MLKVNIVLRLVKNLPGEHRNEESGKTYDNTQADGEIIIYWDIFICGLSGHYHF